jgi:hypothetical protein
MQVAAPLSEFAPLNKSESFALFAFDYRGFGESGGARKQWNPAGWLKDSIAAVQTARTLEGVDPERIVTMGASIGADGAVNACADGCLGALSLSPGNYLGGSYVDSVNNLESEGKAVWCVASNGDSEASPVCNSTSGTLYKKFAYKGGAHGMLLFDPGLDFQIGDVILDFLRTVLGG